MNLSQGSERGSVAQFSIQSQQVLLEAGYESLVLNRRARPAVVVAIVRPAFVADLMTVLSLFRHIAAISFYCTKGRRVQTDEMNGNSRSVLHGSFRPLGRIRRLSRSEEADIGFHPLPPPPDVRPRGLKSHEKETTDQGERNHAATY
jgi:hypothetical protein